MPDRRRKPARHRVSTTPRRRRQPKTKTSEARDVPVPDDLETEFAHALTSARSYVKNPQRLRDLVTQATQKALSLPKGTFQGTLAHLQATLRLMRAYYRGDYRAVPVTTLLIIIAALIYLVNPLDMMPDWIPGVGLLDDAFVFRLAIRRTRQAIDQFLAWESRSTR